MTSSVNERPYLSIGEVLGLLLEEFPDVTISKIRFLESQGLIEPERTSSGYRKFYDGDVERLKVILREQRENFLPLRVIRDRLEARAMDESGGTARDAGAIAAASPTPDDTAAAAPGTEESSAGSAEVPPARTGAATAPRGIRNLRLADVRRAEATAATAAPPDRHPAAQVRGTPVPAAPTATATPSATETATSGATPTPTAGATPTAAAGATPEPATTPGAPARPTATPNGPTATPAAVPAPGAAATGSALRGEVYSRAELCGLCGVTPADLEQLESFGIVAGRGTGANATFNDSDLAIVRAAAGFLARGIDARHMRGWRQSAEREAGLFEQRILPLLRQRNPQARHDATHLLNELASLGGELRGAMVAAILRHHLDP